MDANPRFAEELKLAGSKIIKWVNVEPFIGVIDAQVVKNLRRIYLFPELSGQEGDNRKQISLGFWHCGLEYKVKRA